MSSAKLKVATEYLRQCITCNGKKAIVEFVLDCNTGLDKPVWKVYINEEYSDGYFSLKEADRDVRRLLSL